MRFTADDALDVHVSHQTCYRATRDIDAFPDKLPPDLADAVGLVALLPDAFDLGPQGGITTGTDRQPSRISPLRQMIIVGGRSNRQYRAGRLDPVRIPVRLNEVHHHFDRRSSSAIAKYALALRKVSLAWRNSRFSRSKAFIFSAVSLETPARLPLSTSAF